MSAGEKFVADNSKQSEVVTSKDVAQRLRERLVTVPKPDTKPFDVPATGYFQMGSVGGTHKPGDSAGVLSIFTTFAGSGNKMQEHIYAVDPLCEEGAEEIERLRNIIGNALALCTGEYIAECRDVLALAESSAHETSGCEALVRQWHAATLAMETPDMEAKLTAQRRVVDAERKLMAWADSSAVEPECNQAKAASSGADSVAPTPRGSLPNSLGTSLPEKASAPRCEVRLQYAGGESRCTRDAGHDGTCVY
jgi:hypothetical protein